MAKRGPGWLYALANPMHPPDLLKVGLSTRPPAERAAELSADTGVPMPYTVAHAVYVLDCGVAEDRMHNLLRGRRLVRGREFFTIPLADYVAAVDQLLRDVPELAPRMAPDAPANANLPAPPLRSHEFKGTPTRVTVDTKKKAEPRPNGRPWVPPWVKQ
ncbi:MAG TPA: GIY-YIG nuclease family protein [Sphingomonadaceae bacterium]|nr:GIY-YIG nuclease family protein [Sphingomonadaceae bacterium]